MMSITLGDDIFQHFSAHVNVFFAMLAHTGLGIWQANPNDDPLDNEAAELWKSNEAEAHKRGVCRSPVCTALCAAFVCW